MAVASAHHLVGIMTYTAIPHEARQREDYFLFASRLRRAAGGSAALLGVGLRAAEHAPQHGVVIPKGRPGGRTRQVVLAELLVLRLPPLRQHLERDAVGASGEGAVHQVRCFVWREWLVP